LEQIFSFFFPVRKDPKDDRDYKFATREENKIRFGDIPEKIDHSTKMSLPMNQGKLGSCVGCAGTNLMQYWDNVKSGRNDSNLSEQYLYQECEKIDNHPAEGTYPRCAMQVLKEKGIPIDDAWPYVDEYTPITEPKDWADEDAAKRKIVSYYRITTLKQLLKALAEVGPVLGTISIFDYWYKVTDQMLKVVPGVCLGAHAICLDGYDMEKESISFVNSWGTTWGDKGRGSLSFWYFQKYKQDCWVPIVENKE